MKKILIISLILICLIAIATAITFAVKPQMHKTIQLEQIIFKRSK